jgi:hypothetical protein
MQISKVSVTVFKTFNFRVVLWQYAVSVGIKGMEKSLPSAAKMPYINDILYYKGL